ncbi:hypothetical protein WJX81_003094 [Elliptochloris bilobata]|uniref:J domain-containing protein n=1 Tax=Elliptochloris bilobata TaxID=381761 RepID=A0AAW1RUX4_9CHLO
MPQRSSTVQDGPGAPWWADGEYDTARADRCNEDGMGFLKQAQFSLAFASYSEAIRLCPSSAAYHANRAAAALRLGRYAVALQDARCAIARAPGHLRAHLRAAQACMLLDRPEEALDFYRQALGIKPQCASAQAGAALASKQSASVRADRERDNAAAVLGQRRRLDASPMSTDSAAELLLTADAIMEACPRMQAAKCARVEALIHCRRHAEALDAVKGLVPSIDRTYLEAEALWRSGRLAEALAGLAAVLEDTPGSEKCRSLFAELSSLEQVDAAAAAALAQGRHADCVQLCARALAVPAVEAASGLRAKLLERRARAQTVQGAHGPALADLTAAISLEPAAAACLHLRSQALHLCLAWMLDVFEAVGNPSNAFLDLQRLRAVDPGYPGLFGLLQHAAGRALQQQDRAMPYQGGNAGGCMETHMRVLGLTDCVSHAGVRQAYKQGAAHWHPDKWMHASAAEQADAKQRFLRVRQAYDALVQVSYQT